MHRLLLKLVPMVVTISFAMDVYVASIPEMMVFFHTVPNQVQWTLTVFMFSVCGGQLCLGPLSDRYGRRRIALISAWIFFISSLLCAIAQTMLQLIIFRCFQAIGACGTVVTAYAIVRDCSARSEDRTRNYSYLSGLHAIIAVLAPVVGGLLAELTQHWRTSFIFLSVFSFAVLISVITTLEETLPTERRSPETMRSHFRQYSSLLRDITFFKYVLCTCTAATGLYLFCCFSPHIMMTHYHLSPGQYGIAFGINASIVFLASFASPILCQRLITYRTVCLGMTIMLFALVVMTVANRVWPSLMSLLLPMFLFSVGVGFVFGPATAMALDNYQHMAGAAMAFLGGMEYGISALLGVLFAHDDTITVTHFIMPVAIILAVTALFACLDKPFSAPTN